MTTVYKFKVYYTKTGIGTAPANAPTVDVVDVDADSKLVTGQAAVAKTNLTGYYEYEYSGADGLDLVGHFNTADSTMDQQDLCSYVSDKITTNVNAAITSRSSHSAADVWDVALAGHVTAGTSGKALTDSSANGDPWAAAVRTLTQSAATIAAAVSGSTLTIQRGDTFTAAITGLGNISARSKLWLTIKRSPDLLDADATIQIEESAGLTIVNGANYATTTNGSIVVNNAVTGALTITIKPAVTVNLDGRGLVYDIQMLTSSGVVTTLASGAANISDDVTRAVS